jgi:hypothetical protein
MDVRFLKDISEAYVVDTGLSVESEQIFEELYDVVKFLQVYDNSLYNELYEETKFKQQKILKNYLDISYENQTLYEIDLVVGSGTILLWIILHMFRGTISKGFWNIVATLGEGVETLGKFLARHGKYFQIRYAIVQENTRKCYAHCGITKPSDISALTYTSIKSSSYVATPKSIEQGKCLRECYILELIEVIALHMENYFACLKRTGGFDVVQKTDSDDIMKMVSSTNISAACESYYNAAREALDNFYRILELVYDSHSEADKRLEKINALRTKIYEARQSVQKVNQNEIRRYDSNSTRSTQQSNQNEIRRYDSNSTRSTQQPNPNFRRS